MNLADSHEDAAFRETVKSWIASSLPEGWMSSVFEPVEEAERARFRLDWERKLYQGGWSGISWPRDYGGRGLSVMRQAIFLEELARQNAPEGLNAPGRNLVGPTLIAWGSEEQKLRYLPRIISAEEIWCQGFSEPGAGSDLASLRCSAVSDGDSLVVNGQKIWTSWAQYAQWCFLLVRTSPSRHDGLTFVLVDMATPGITIRPLVQITGESEFSEVFFDDVRVPAANIVGRPGDGWKIAMTTLAYERGPEEALARQVRFRTQFERMVAAATLDPAGNGPAAADPVLRQKLAAAYCDVELMRLICLRNLSRQARGGEPGPETSFIKLFWSHMWQRMNDVALELQGPLSVLVEGDELVPARGEMQRAYLLSRASTIYSGSSEIQRTIIGERVLGLPR